MGESLFVGGVPKVAADTDPARVELGVRFTVAVKGSVTGVRFYKGPGNSGAHTGSLWSGPTRVKSGTFRGETASGWQTLLFPTPAPVSPGVTYTASVLNPVGRYPVDNPYRWPRTVGDLAGIKGVYRYGGGRPTQTYETSNYWVDVIFESAGGVAAPAATGRGSAMPITVSGMAHYVPDRSVVGVRAVGVGAGRAAVVTGAVVGGGKPDASNTGVPAGTSLTAYAGPLNITTNNTIIDSKDIVGELSINATGVQISKCKIHGTGLNTVGITSNGNAVSVTDCEIYGFATGMVYGGLTVTRCHLHDLTYDGIKMSSNSTIKDSYVHAAQPNDGAHFDGIQVQDGVVNVLIQGNNFDMSDSAAGVDGGYLNSCLFLCPDLGPSTAGPLTVTGNWFNGGTFSVHVLDGNNGAYFIADISITNNRFGRVSEWGPFRANVPFTQSGNVWDDTSAPLTL